MSRNLHLPPRCRANRINGTHGLIKFPSLDTIQEEKPSWLDDILTESDINNPKESLLRRSCSDPTTIDEVSKNLHNIKWQGSGEWGEIYSGFEEKCLYGPNSPRRKSDLSESEISALMESMPPNKLQYMTVNYADKRFDQDMAASRPFGRRSRVNKIKYIAELEKTVEAYQASGAELAARVASLFQQRVALSLENKNLRMQIVNLQQEKIIKNGEHQYLQNEAERLRVQYDHHHLQRRSKSEAESWKMLDFGKLNLGDDQIPLSHDYNC